MNQSQVLVLIFPVSSDQKGGLHLFSFSIHF